MTKAAKRATTVLAMVAASAIGAPVANAQAIDPASTGPASEVVSGDGYGFPNLASTGPASEVVSGDGYGFPSQPTNPIPTAKTSSGGGFDWGDAGIGAAAMLSLLGLGAGAAVSIRRTRGQQTQVS
jgi:hypothetical protein